MRNENYKELEIICKKNDIVDDIYKRLKTAKQNIKRKKIYAGVYISVVVVSYLLYICINTRTQTVYNLLLIILGICIIPKIFLFVYEVYLRKKTRKEVEDYEINYMNSYLKNNHIKFATPIRSQQSNIVNITMNYCNKKMNIDISSLEDNIIDKIKIEHQIITNYFYKWDDNIFDFVIETQLDDLYEKAIILNN